ncbi:MAG: CDP-diacylglycerol--glycerol-3-phosphate 3-phosphatidyltransferase [Cellulosilyticaceae bacterium]
MNIANKLTVGRVVLVFVFMALIWMPGVALEVSLWSSLVVFVIASFTDFLDGYLARKHNLVTNLGKFMDPLADKMLVTAAMIAIVDKADVLPAGVLPAWIVVVILLREFTISGIRLVAATDNVVIAANQLGKIKTVLQMAMIIVYLTPISHPMWQLLAIVLAYAALVLTIVSGAQYIWQNRQVLQVK